MKLKFINKIFYLSLSIFLLFVFSEASVRKDIENLNTVGQLKAYYESNSSDLYKVRYIVKYLPDFLEKYGVSTCPDWVASLAENSLYTSYAPLITESISLIGKFKLIGHTDRLYELFLVASSDYANFSTMMRFAIIRALSQINGDYEKLILVKLFNSFPEGLIELREFGLLAHEVASLELIPVDGERVIGSKNTQYIDKADIELSNLDPEKFEDEDKYNYLTSVKYDLEKISNNISLLEKGDNK